MGALKLPPGPTRKLCLLSLWAAGGKGTRKKMMGREERRRKKRGKKQEKKTVGEGGKRGGTEKGEWSREEADQKWLSGRAAHSSWPCRS